jgi:DNA-binding winged helix-turn-helix (wHTH) protein
MSTQEKHDLPLTFRKEVVDSILTCLMAGESCAMVGIGSVGKSNLLRFLQREDVHRAKLGQEWDSYLFVYIDANKLLEQSLWGLSELTLHQVLISLTDHGADEVALQKIDDLHQRSTAPPTRHLALRYLDRAVGLVCRHLGLRIVFLIDEFDNLCRMLSPRGFAALRALRDDHKYRLMYVVATRLELSRLREEIEEIEPFEELVSLNTIWLGPYSEDDARFMLHRLEARHDIRLDERTTHHLVAAAGGHPGLLRAAYRVAIEHPSDLAHAALAHSPRVRDECRRVWLSLVSREQKAITALASAAGAGSVGSDTLKQLHYKGMTGGPWSEDNQVFSPLFAEYIRQEQPTIGAHIQVDRKRRMVWVSGHAIQDLPPLEYRFLEYLESKRGQVCSRDELARHLYPEEVFGEGVSDARLDAVVKRVRKRIEPVPGEQRYIETVWGQGFRLVDGDEEVD